ncbi:unnamed protein product, partial [Rotaria sordida]
AAQQETVQYISEVTRPYLVPGTDIQHIEQKQIIDHVPVAPTSLSYYEQQPMPVPVSQVQETYIQPTGTLGYAREIYESQKPIYDYGAAEQQPSQYLYNVGDVQQQQQQAAQQETVQYISEVTRPYLVPGTDIQHIEQKQIIDHVPVAPTS